MNCQTCDGTGELPGPELCPSCTTPTLTRFHRAATKRALIAAAWKHSHARGLARFVLVAMASRSDHNGRSDLSERLLATMCGCSEKCVREGRAKLVDLGEAVRESRSVYRVRHLIASTE